MTLAKDLVTSTRRNKKVMHWKGDAKRTVITEDEMSLIQAKQDRLVTAQQIRMHT